MQDCVSPRVLTGGADHALQPRLSTDCRKTPCDAPQLRIIVLIHGQPLFAAACNIHRVKQCDMASCSDLRSSHRRRDVRLPDHPPNARLRLRLAVRQCGFFGPPANQKTPPRTACLTAAGFCFRQERLVAEVTTSLTGWPYSSSSLTSSSSSPSFSAFSARTALRDSLTRF